jgi:hypothetical protein
MDAAALGRLDSGGRRTSRGRDGRAANRGGGGRERTGEAMGSGWVREGEQCGAMLTCGPGSTVAGGANSNWIQNYFKWVQSSQNFN